MSPFVGKKVRIFFINVGLLLVSLFLVFCGLEIYLRMVGFKPREYVPESYLNSFYAGKLNPDFIYLGGEIVEYKIPVHINNMYFREKDFSCGEKPSNTFRIIVLGDSYVEALQVPLEKTFHKILEKKLNSGENHNSTKFETLSFGRGGYGQVSEYHLFEFGLKCKPDLFLIEFNSYNDLYDNYPVLKKKVDGIVSENRKRKYSRKTLNEKLIFSDKLRVNHFLAERIADLYTECPIICKQKVPPDWLAYTDEQDPMIDEAWKITLEYLLKMKKESDENHVQFVIFSKDTTFDFIGWRERIKYKDYGSCHWDPERPLRTIMAFCEKNSIPLIDLTGPMNEHRKKNGIDSLRFKFDGHWNETAHDIAANTIFDAFIKMKIVN